MDLSGFDTYYGVKISCVGDDGTEMILLGHVERRLAVAVVRAYLRKLWGPGPDLDRYLDCRLGRDPWAYQRVAARDALGIFEPVDHRWAVVVRKCDRWPMCLDPDGYCGEPASCAEIASHDWFLTWDNVGPDTPGSFPISFWAE